MGKLFSFINIPFGYALRFLADFFGGNFAASVLLFTLLIDLILIPLTIKGQKSSVAQLRIKPKLDELKKRFGDDKQKMATAQQKLYQDEGVSMAGGCLPMIIRLVILLAIYSLIQSPITYMADVKESKVDNVITTVQAGMQTLKNSDKEEDIKKYNEIENTYNVMRASSTFQLPIVKVVEKDGLIEELLSEKEFNKIKDDYNEIKEKNKEVDYNLFGIDLTDVPSFNIDIFNKFQRNWFMPIIAFLSQMLMSYVSMVINKINNPDAPQMKGMMLTMPLISLFFGFTLPCGVCFYWICSSIIGGIIQAGVQVFYGPKKVLARNRAKELIKECNFEATQLQKFGK